MRNLPVKITPLKKKRFQQITIALILSVIGIYSYFSWIGSGYLLPGYHTFIYTPEAYHTQLDNTYHRQKAYQMEVDTTQDTLSRELKLLASAFFAKKLTEVVFPYWYGTDYNFYGTTQTPGQGKIACGYFVTTVLEDMGITLDRVELAKAASETMIRALVEPSHVQRFSRKTMDQFLGGIRERGVGIYIVGLDRHTGFIVNLDPDDIRFVHASGRRPLCVINEPATTARSLIKSKYRVIGKLTMDERFFKNWLALK